MVETYKITKKAVEHVVDSDIYCMWYKRLERKTGGIGNYRKNRNHTDYSISEIVHNTEKSPGDLRRLAVTQTPMKDQPQTLMWKTGYV